MRNFVLALAAVLSLAIVSDAAAENFTFTYVARTGNFNGDGLTDIYLEHRSKIVPIPFDDLLIPVPLLQRAVGQFVLQQNAQGGFDVLALSSSQVASVRQWATAAIEIIASDFDADGNRDVLLKGVQAVIPGAKDVIVFAPEVKGATPPAVRSLDSSFQMFVTDVNGFSQNTEHYYDNAWIPAPPLVVPWPANYYDCGWPTGIVAYWEGSIGDFIASFECVYLFTTWEPRLLEVEALDLSRFSGIAYQLNYAIEPYLPNLGSSLVSVDSETTRSVFQRWGQALGRVIAPDSIPPGPIDIPPDATGEGVSGWRVLGLLGRLAALIGGLAYPSEIAGDDEAARKRELYFHYSYTEWVGSFKDGLWEWTWVVRPPEMRGLVAQDKLALPIHFADDRPPNIYFNVWIDEDAHRFDNVEPPQVVFWTKSLPYFSKQRNGGGLTTLLERPITPDQMAGPFPVAP